MNDLRKDTSTAQGVVEIKESDKTFNSGTDHVHDRNFTPFQTTIGAEGGIHLMMDVHHE